MQHSPELEGIVHRPLPIEAWTRENCIVAETASGHQDHFGVPGPSLREDE